MDSVIRILKISKTQIDERALKLVAVMCSQQFNQMENVTDVCAALLVTSDGRSSQHLLQILLK
jgi:hypothetical protein